MRMQDLIIKGALSLYAPFICSTQTLEKFALARGVHHSQAAGITGLSASCGPGTCPAGTTAEAPRTCFS